MTDQTPVRFASEAARSAALDDAIELPQAPALAEAFVALADTLVADYDVVDLMDRLIETSVGLLDVKAAGILLVDQRGGLQLVASSSEGSRLLELFQLQDAEGPCLDCIATGQAVHADELSAGQRWPEFARQAAEHG